MAWDLGGAGILKESRFKVDIFNILGQDGVDDMNCLLYTSDAAY